MQEIFNIACCSACHKRGNSLFGDKAANCFHLPTHNQTKVCGQQNQPAHKHKQKHDCQSIMTWHWNCMKMNQETENEQLKLKSHSENKPTKKWQDKNCQEVFPETLMWWCGATHTLELMCVTSCGATCVAAHDITWWSLAWVFFHVMMHHVIVHDASHVKKPPHECRDVIVGPHACGPTWHHVMKTIKNVLIFFTWWCTA